jgi:5-methylcytosine-specific restriction enzyme subunit McrC
VAYLFTEYAKKNGGWSIHPQHTAYYLVDEHRDKGGIFKLRPDIVAISDNDNNDVRILDTKWKIVNAKDMRGNYGISQADMYQLYAYGQKYRIKNDNNNPQLTLLYPATDKFNKEQIIEEFIYDDVESGLKIKAVPFDLSDKETYNVQIDNILNIP